MCLNNSMCGCSGNGHSNGECNALGPFVAIDAACIVPQPPAQLTAGAIIPFSSGLVPAELSSVLGDTAATVSLIGFGTNVPGVDLVGGIISITSALAGTEAFSVPRAGSITAISAAFTVLTGATLAANSTIRAQVYRATGTSNAFSATDAFVDLTPTLTVPVSVNQTVTGTKIIIPPVTVAAGDRLLMVFSVITAGLLESSIVTGFANAGINIA